MLRRTLFPLALSSVAALAAAACGGNVVVDGTGATGTGAASTGATSTGATSTGTTSTSTCASLPDGGSVPAGDCQTDADCKGGTCAPITPGGYLVCRVAYPQATSCMMPPDGPNQCCTSADCKQGACYSAEIFPYCGGPAKPIYNVCASDACATDADCAADAGANPPRLCAPAGVYDFPIRSCVTAYCHTDADCTAHPCGACAAVYGPCCAFPTGLGCVYPGGCVQNSDCAPQEACFLDPTTGTGECTSNKMPCPS